MCKVAGKEDCKYHAVTGSDLLALASTWKRILFETSTTASRRSAPSVTFLNTEANSTAASCEAGEFLVRPTMVFTCSAAVESFECVRATGIVVTRLNLSLIHI
eukprot:TRINITY_DN7731_c0_g1_i1.p2 TRINITY_DN7731_c0_g1~~TRINITY_DN7731_c0_g1_i1.p2  ORF type:complete len:103 (+),score=15.69 TRINITY_DN7731_c0_g1_i1:370-678(+)